MVLTSGVIPYEYATTLPVRVRNTRIGLSGVFLEQAAFVLLAEARRRNGIVGGDHDINPIFAKYFEGNHDAANISPGPRGPVTFFGGGQFMGSGVLEPSNSDQVFVKRPPPGGAWIIDYIRDLRYYLNVLFGGISLDSGKSNELVRGDWFTQLYPGSISGQMLGTHLHRMPFLQNDDGISASGKIMDLSLDVFGQSVLGASGVLYDIDVGEVMFNPWPYFRILTNARFYLNETLSYDGAPFGPVSPFFPAFQKTNGNILTPTSRDSGFIQDSSSDDLGYSHIGSGYIRVDGDVLQDGTLYLLAPLNSPLNVTASTQFTHEVNGARQFFVGSDGKASGYARAYISPSPQSAGQYKIYCKNPRSTFPQTAIESGQISITDWQVFDDALAFHVPSGVGIVSPFTGDVMYVFCAQPDLHTSISKLIESELSSARGWIDSPHMDRIGSTIYKWLGYNTVSTGPVTLKPVVSSYDDQDFDKISNILGDTFDYAASTDTPDTVGFWTDGSNFFASFDKSNTSPKVFRFNGTGFTLFEPATGAFGTGYHPDLDNGGSNATDTFKGRVIGGTTYGFAVVDGTGNEPSLSGIAEITYNDAYMRDIPPLTEYPIYIVSNPKELIIEPSLVGLSSSTNYNTLIVEIIDMREVSGGVSVTDGIWFLIRIINSSVYSYFFVRATEGGSTWTAQEVLQINGVKSNSSGDPEPLSFFHLSIP